MKKHEEYSELCRLKKLEKFNSKIRAASKKLMPLLSYSDKKYLIRPATTAKEIIREGQLQRHCVGGIGYISSAANGEIAIMFIRSVDDPEAPLYTMEYDLKKLKVVQ